MVDIKLLQKDYDSVAAKLQRKGVEEEILASLKALALKAKDKRQAMEEVTASQNLLSKEFGRYKKEGLDIAS
ncbi:MAG: serine--tRNA ligase, partial [Deltaproteobacteria bacterium HGW-Deltaproteobacteria-24]